MLTRCACFVIFASNHIFGFVTLCRKQAKLLRVSCMLPLKNSKYSHAENEKPTLENCHSNALTPMQKIGLGRREDGGGDDDFEEDEDEDEDGMRITMTVAMTMTMGVAMAETAIMVMVLMMALVMMMMMMMMRAMATAIAVMMLMMMNHHHAGVVFACFSWNRPLVSEGQRLPSFLLLILIVPCLSVRSMGLC